MRFMNEYDVARAAQVADRNDWTNRAEAVRQVEALMEWANANSDGWAYWPKPARAAAKLMLLITGDGTNAADGRPDATAAELRAALAPVKAFRTRMLNAGMGSGR